MPRSWSVVLSICLMLCWNLPAHGAVPSEFEYIVTTDAAQVSEVIDHPDWQSAPGGRSLGYSDATHWLRWPVPPGDSDVLVIHNAWLDDFELFFVNDGQVLASYHTGGAHPVSSRPIDHPEFAFPIPQSPRATEVYVRDFQSSAALLYPLEFLGRDQLMLASARTHGWHGMYYGIVLIMLIYNLVIFRTVRDRAYLYFVAYAASLMALLSTSDGFGQLYLWPDLPAVQRLLPSFAMILLFVFIAEFCIQFLDTRHHTPRLTRLLRVMQGVVTLNGALVLAFDSSINTTLEPVITVAFVTLLISVAVVRTMQRDSAARIFLLANGIMGIAGAWVALIHLGVIQDTPFGRQATLAGSAVEISLLSLALGLRLRRREQQQQLLKERSLGLARRVKELQTATGLAEEHRQLQRSMQQAQKLKTIGQMAGGIAHDFNNILATILGFAELARDKSAAQDKEKQTRYLEEIQQAGERGAALVKQLLTYSRGATKETKEINLNKTVDEIGNLLRGSLPTTVSIKTHIPNKAIHTVLDPAQLQQVLVNLALNASESMQDRGEIDITLERLEIDNLQCSSCLARFGGDFVRIKLEDNGAGFEGNGHDLFTPFFTSKPVGQGSGLGLSVVHGIVHEHRGHVQMNNRSRGGARFSIYLPINAISHTAEIVGQRILLIEDDASVGRYLETLLGDNAYNVTSVSLPTQALEEFMAHPDAFDLIITDQLMPHGTGLELAEDMHELRPELPVIITTGNPADIKADEIARAGIKAVFGKPIESELLLAKVRGLLSTNV